MFAASAVALIKHARLWCLCWSLSSGCFRCLLVHDETHRSTKMSLLSRRLEAFATSVLDLIKAGNVSEDVAMCHHVSPKRSILRLLELHICLLCDRNFTSPTILTNLSCELASARTSVRWARLGVCFLLDKFGQCIESYIKIIESI